MKLLAAIIEQILSSPRHNAIRRALKSKGPAQIGWILKELPQYIDSHSVPQPIRKCRIKEIVMSGGRNAIKLVSEKNLRQLWEEQRRWFPEYMEAVQKIVEKKEEEKGPLGPPEAKNISLSHNPHSLFCEETSPGKRKPEEDMGPQGLLSSRV